MNGLEVMNLVEGKIHEMDGVEENSAVQMREIWSYLFKLCGTAKLNKMTKAELLDLVEVLKSESPAEFLEWEEEYYKDVLRKFRAMVYQTDNEDGAEFEKEYSTKEMGSDIHFLLASLYIWYSDAGRDAYESSSFKQLSEKYSFYVGNVEEARKIRDELKKIMVSKN